MSIAQLIVNNSAVALSLIKGWAGQPNLNGVPIKSTRCDCIMDAEVSRHVLINLSQQLQNVMDNVAPGPRTWEIEGTIGGFPFELTSLYMPSLQLMITTLQGLFQSRQQMTFLDPYFNSAQVLISHFEYNFRAEVQNRVPVKISLVEITILTSQVGVGTIQGLTPSATAGAALPSAGSGLTTPAAMGASGSTALSIHRHAERSAICTVCSRAVATYSRRCFLKTVNASYVVNWPLAAANASSFTFTTQNALGSFTFVLKYMNGQWNGWCTLPSGEVRQFGCVPDVVDWTEFPDYGIVIDSSLTSFQQSNLIGNSALYLLQWGNT